jgi:mono/diheme cytochrome c family protein
LSNPLFTDSDYFWRMSEGLPWASMPAWKSQYSTDDRWRLVHYIRVNFTQTEARPASPKPDSQVYPSFYLGQKTFPEANFMRGQNIYVNSCAACHGLSGEGEGWDGAYLDVLPTDFTYGKAKTVPEARLYTMTLFGVQNSAMPAWAEQLPDEQLWDVVTYINKAFQTGGGIKNSQFGSGKVAATTITLSQDDWTKEGHIISPDNGAAVYAAYCTQCHGAAGDGKGYNGGFLPGGGPAAFNPAMTQQYAFWRVYDGIPESVMVPFYLMLPESDIWDVVTYTIGMTSKQPVGNAANAPTRPVFGALATGTLPIGLGGGR